MNSISNGLISNTTKSMVKTISDFDSFDMIKHYIKSRSDVVAYLDNEVLIGKYNQAFIFPENKEIKIRFVKRLRIFNQNEEFHIWRSSAGLKGRYRMDGDGKNTDFIESHQVLYGTKSECNEKDNYTVLSEQNGAEIVLPGKWMADNNRERVAIRTRHYIDYKDGYQATYVDARFMEFVQLPKGGE
ncbi:MAG TPA: TIGR03984 family CRISPR-associated protein [candidate division Zixibacteria bacterium]|nr:TIGR03984 family CRISPR-associated protein [candidate division Zixibacteria bacterium]